MRGAAVLLTGLVLLGAGITVMAADLPGRWVLGPLLVVAGLAVKTTGFVLDSRSRPGPRTVTTLGAGPHRDPGPDAAPATPPATPPVTPVPGVGSGIRRSEPGG